MKVSEMKMASTIMEWGRSHQKNQRLGQYLMGELVPSESRSEIYYEEDLEKAVQLFIEKFVSLGA